MRRRTYGPNRAVNPEVQAVLDWMQAQNIDMKEAATLAGISYQTIKDWRAGRIAVPKPGMLDYVKQAIGYPQ